VVRGAFVGFCAVLVAAIAAGCGASSAAQPTTTVRQLRQFRVLFPEGFTRAQMIDRVGAVAKIAENESHRKVRLSADTYAAATARPRRFPGFGDKKLPYEGFLFPDTYDFDRESTSAQLVSNQVGEFTSMFGQLNLSYARSKNLTPYDVLTIASILEGEAQVPKELPLVSAVIYNRLRLGMTLGMDSTLRYGLHVPGTQSLTQSELANPTPYNTRLHTGLPPTPIGNPGLLALEAAAHPAHVDYLYFVRKPDHLHHYFTANYQDFLQHEAQYGY
jgi:uncharacterized YceG family protein